MASRADAILAMLKKSPDDVFLHYSLGMEYASAGKAQEAAGEFRRCMELDRSYVPAYVECGKAMRAAGRMDKAKAVFTEALKLAAAKGDSHVADFIRQQLEGLS